MALSLGLPPPGVTRHPALRSSDFPPAPCDAGDYLVSPDASRYMSAFSKKQDLMIYLNAVEIQIILLYYKIKDYYQEENLHD